LLEYDCAFSQPLVGQAVVDVVWRQVHERAVVMLVVVPVDQVVRTAARVLKAPEVTRELRPVLERLELRLAEGVVVRYVRAAVCLGDAEVGVELRQGLALHRATAIAVDRELTRFDALPFAGLTDELLGKLA
jgi:uncharacterized protein (DUF1499 family)